MTEQVKCVDCKHRKVTLADFFSTSVKFRGTCLKTFVPEKRVFDPVVGDEVTPAHYESPSFARLSSRACGPDGKLWEPKNKKDLFKFIKHVGA